MPSSNPQGGKQVEVRGSAFAEIHLSGRRALSVLTEGWTDEERQALLDGDNEAKGELLDALCFALKDAPGEFDVVHWEMRVEESANA